MTAPMPKDNEVDEKVIWSDDLAAVLEAASEASQVPLMWLANQDFSPEQTKAWLCEAVDATVEEGAFSGALHQVAEEGTGHVVAFTGCGPKSAANAKFLIGCAHFILKHRDSLSDHAATVAELRAEVERLRKSNELYSFAMNTAGIDELKRRADAAERRVGELEANDRRYRFLRRKLCVTGNGDGTCAMQAINLPHRIHGWPEHGEHEQFFDAAIDSYLTGADPT